MKKLIVLALAVLMALSITACGGTASSSSSKADASSKKVEAEKEEPPVLTGDWKQVNSSSDDTYHQATITDSTIEINWVSDNGDTKSLYWAGSYTAPTDSKTPYTWESANDTSKTDSALMASTDKTKKFTYDGKQITYEASMMGTTKTIRLEKVK